MATAAPNNRLLNTLDPTAFALLQPNLTRVDLTQHQIVETPGADILQVYFVETGIVSVVATSSEHESIEAGLIAMRA